MTILSTAQNLAALQRARYGGKRYKPSLPMQMLLSFGQAVRVGTFYLILPDGSIRTLRGRMPGPEAVCVIHDDSFGWRFMIRGILGFCEGYLDGHWSSPDTTTLFELALLNEKAFQDLILGHEWYRVIEGVLNNLNRNSKRGSKRNIAYHYDLGNAFYSKWLDHSMTYSAAVFPIGTEVNSSALPLAQKNKYAEMVQRLGLQPDHHVLEIGCGWGGFAEFAAGEIGSRVTGLTISREQYDFASQRIQKAGLNEKVTIKFCDYRDCEGQFDRIASIEMFEAVGEKYWPGFFGKVAERLKPDGVAAMQIITIDERHFEPYRRGADYIQKYIFPGGLLPTVQILKNLIGGAGMKWQDACNFGLHYANTLAIWQQNFQNAWPDIKQQGFDDRFKRMWEQYFHYCEAGFRAGTVDVYQLAMRRS
jgi:cyclopropane-fatty-acyl-phospholipid synthase